MALAPRWIDSQMRQILRDIEEEYGDDVVTNNLVKYSLDDTPAHVTIKYGLHAESYDFLKPIMKEYHKGFVINITGIEVFRNNDNEDVLVARCEAPALVKIREAVTQANPDHEETYPEYKPHMTFAYFTPGAAQGFLDTLGERWFMEAMDTMSFKCDQIMFSNKDGVQSILTLSDLA